MEERNNINNELMQLKNLVDKSNSFNKESFVKQIKRLLSLSGTGSLNEEVNKLFDIVARYGTGDSFYRQLIRLLSFADNKDGVYKSVGDTFCEDYQQIKPGEGISFLCPAIDERTGGISKGELCTILGASGSMKTTYSSNIAYNAVKKGKNVIFLSLEEQPFQLYCKWLSRASVDLGRNLSTQDIIQHKLNEKDTNRLLDEVEPYFRSLEGNLYILGERDLWNYSLQTLEDKFREIDFIAQEQTGHGIDLLVVDHIQLLKYAAESMDPTNTINMYVSFFRQQCLSWLHEDRSIAVILLSQANRDGLKYAEKHQGEYLATHVAEASEVIRASSYIISVYTDAEIQRSNLLILSCIKLRGAQLPIGVTNVFADGATYQAGDTAVGSLDYTLDDLMGSNVEKEELTKADMNASGIFSGFAEEKEKQYGIMDLGSILKQL